MLFVDVFNSLFVEQSRHLVCAVCVFGRARASEKRTPSFDPTFLISCIVLRTDNARVKPSVKASSFFKLYSKLARCSFHMRLILVHHSMFFLGD
mmetsp:Transcript_26021/g.41863  ORF Transcript_26021/g.41863 Transcript_26021/m.41863 type:complete len:94 (+) Transcript_26021:790-1071(+)